MERFIVIARRYLFIRGSNSAFVHLFISKRLIHGAASALMGVFVPIFLYKISGEKFYVVGGYFALASLIYAVVLAWGAQIMDNIGTRICLIIAGIFNAAYYAILYLMDETNLWLYIVPLGLSLLFVRIFHWVPYRVDFAIFTKDGERGRDVSITYATIAFMGVVGPILAGYIIKHSGYDTLFAISVVLLVAATISYWFVPATNEQFTWTYLQTWKKLFSRKFRPAVLGSFANGLEIPVTLVAWPIFLYEILDGDVFEIGALATVITAATIVIQLFVGRHIDKGATEKKKTLRVGSFLYAIGWVVKIFVLSATQIFFVGLYHNVTKVFTRTPFDTILYDMSADQGHYVDEFTVLREMATHLGRFLSLTVIVVLTLFISIKWTFLIGAGAALLLNLIYRSVTD